MKARIAITLLLAALLLSGAAAWGQAASLAQAGGPAYRLTSVTWQARGPVAGGGYWLLPLVQPALTGTGCCCAYLPCVMK